MDNSQHIDMDFRALLALKRKEHKDLDRAIESLISDPQIDQLQLRRLKKKKLSLKDEIKALEEQFFPDIIA